jgi:hypothetical protein
MSYQDHIKVFHCRGKRAVKALTKTYSDINRYHIVEDDEYFDYDYSPWDLSDTVEHIQ